MNNDIEIVVDDGEERTNVDGLVDRRCRSWSMQASGERQWRMRYVLALASELEKIRKETMFATTWAEWAIEAIITGEVDDLRLWGIAHLSETELLRMVGTVEHSSYYAKVYEGFREICAQADQEWISKETT